ncbi:MAG: Translation initiation factor 2 subunit alpha [Candidatus Heimdallarchaeota archaeon LC_3]|nr:MAG: Translation initiation factor 2 subunit alpha [Candidatus Heimdallarchaeota archaeon LC_3]
MPRRKKKSSKKVISEVVDETEKTEEVKKEIIPQPVEKKEKKSVQFTEADFPSKGELIIGKCTKITPHGAYFLIEGYEKLGETAGFVHISELSKTWIRNIRKHIKEGQKSVSKVLRINPQRAEVDLSIRRTTEAQKRNTLKIFKQESRAKSILGMSKDQLELNDESMDAITETLYAHFGQLVTALEKTRDNDYKILVDIGIEEKVARVIADLATKELENTSVQLGGKLRCSLYVKNGLEIFKSAINDSIKQAKENDALNVYVQNISAPDYRITIEADDWKKAEKSWKSFQSNMEKKISKHSPIIIEFSRI